MVVYKGTKVVYNKVSMAGSFFKRLRGLMWKKHLNEGEGLLITKCNQVHMFNMRFALDIVYLSDDMRVVKIDTLRPRQVGRLVKDASAVLEVSAGSAAANGISPGDYLEFKA